MIPYFPDNIRIRLAFLNWDSQQGRDLATSGRNKQKFQLGQSYSYIMRKVWCHQIWIQNNSGFMVSDLLDGQVNTKYTQIRWNQMQTPRKVSKYLTLDLETVSQNLWLTNGCFTTTCRQILEHYVKSVHKNVTPTVIMRCWTGLNLNWFKSYDTNAQKRKKIAMY